MLDALHDGLGAAWDKTTIVVATEFGRTAAVNGTGGTDHGTGTAAMLLGGAVRGGRVLADWPGLRPSDLYEGRDLRPTMSLDDVIAGAASETFGLDPHRTGAALFPQTNAIRPHDVRRQLDADRRRGGHPRHDARGFVDRADGVRRFVGDRRCVEPRPRTIGGPHCHVARFVARSGRGKEMIRTDTHVISAVPKALGSNAR